MTYKTSVWVNGAVAENIIYDVLTEKENRLAIKGKNLYSFEELYPDDENQLLAEVILSSIYRKLRINSTIKTAKLAKPATVSKLFSFQLKNNATINPAIAEKMLPVEKKIAGIVIAPKTA